MFIRIICTIQQFLGKYTTERFNAFPLLRYLHYIFDPPPPTHHQDYYMLSKESILIFRNATLESWVPGIQVLSRFIYTNMISFGK